MTEILIGRNDSTSVNLDPRYGNPVVRTMVSQIGRQILRGVLGGIFGGKR